MALYSSEFFSGQSTGSRRSAEEVVPLVLDLIRPLSVVDVGCGVGTWIDVFRSEGISDVLGIDGEYVARSQLLIPEDRFLAADLTRALTLERAFDLVVSLEVAEHLPETAARDFIRTLVGLGPVVLFSAAIPGQGGHHHLNEQWPGYWATLFEEHDHIPQDILRPKIWNNPEIDWWYRQNMLLFVRRDDIASLQALRDLHDSKSGQPLALVHPELFREVSAMAMRSLGSTIWSSGRGLARRVFDYHLPSVVKDQVRRLRNLQLP